jgi:mono/diheme cytochrome c family protein
MDQGEDVKFTLRLALVVVIACSLSLLLAVDKGDAQKGKAVYATKCATCHGDKGEVKPAIEKMFGVTMKALGSKEAQGMSDEQLEKEILEGKGKIKAVKVTKAEAADIVAYMRTLAQAKK